MNSQIMDSSAYALHIANKNYSSWSLRPWVLMRQLGIPFTEVMHPFGEGSNLLEFRKFAPNGKVPCLQNGSQTIWDSLAIVEYLAENHAGVWASDAVARAWSRCAAAEMHSGFGNLRNQCPMSCGVRVKMNAPLSKDLLADIARLVELWDDGLSRFGGPFLAGKSFTAVDAFFAPVVWRINTYGLPVSLGAAKYVKLMIAQLAMQDWYKAALVEGMSDTAHDDDVCRHGVLAEDLRVKA